MNINTLAPNILLYSFKVVLGKTDISALSIVVNAILLWSYLNDFLASFIQYATQNHPQNHQTFFHFPWGLKD